MHQIKAERYIIPEQKRVRVIIDSDANCECDDQYAIVHALLTPKVQVMGLIAEQYGEPDSMEQSFQELWRICRLGGFDTALVHRGIPRALSAEGESRGGVDTVEPDQGAQDMECPDQEAEGIDFLIHEALRRDPRPLFVICQGALTNVASALRKRPEIAARMLLVVVGGCNYPKGGYEFNTMNDPFAFNAVMNSPVPIWMLPEEVYATMQAGMAELADKLLPCGEIGRYLVENTFRTVDRMWKKIPDDSRADPYGYAIGFPNGESWSLGDSVGIGVLLSHYSGSFQEVKAPNVAEDGTYFFRKNPKTIRWYRDINQRLILEDLFAKMKESYGKK